MRLLQGLRQYLTLGHVEVLAVPLEGLVRPHAGNHLDGFPELVTRGIRIHAEGFPLLAAGFGQPQLEAAAAQQIQGGRALSHPQRVIDAERREDAGMTHPQARGVL